MENANNFYTNAKKVLISWQTLCLLALATSLVFMSFTNRAGIRFMYWNFDETKHQAKFRKKPIFIFIYSPTCLKSQRMDDIFKMPKVAALYNKSFLSNKYDTEKITQRMQAIKWGVKSYPSYLFFTTDGDLATLEEGYKKHDEAIAMAENALMEIALVSDKAKVKFYDEKTSEGDENLKGAKGLKAKTKEAEKKKQEDKDKLEQLSEED